MAVKAGLADQERQTAAKLARYAVDLAADIVEHRCLQAPVDEATRHLFYAVAAAAIRFTDRKPLRTWMDLTTADKDLGWRWALELLKRGLLVNPNEKFYISIAHSDADIDRTLGIADEAFGALRAAR